jgi:hypothetical protein
MINCFKKKKKKKKRNAIRRSINLSLSLSKIDVIFKITIKCVIDYYRILIQMMILKVTSILGELKEDTSLAY